MGIKRNHSSRMCQKHMRPRELSDLVSQTSTVCLQTNVSNTPILKVRWKYYGSRLSGFPRSMIRSTFDFFLHILTHIFVFKRNHVSSFAKIYANNPFVGKLTIKCIIYHVRTAPCSRSIDCVARAGLILSVRHAEAL